MRSSAAQIGIALDGERMSCVWPEGAARRVQSTECDGSAGAIGDALATLLRNAPGVSRVNVTLCRPLLQTRTLSMRGVSRADVERVLSRDWSRHMIPLRPGAQSVTVRAIPSGEWHAQFVSHETMEALAKAAAEYGWDQLTIRSVDDALAEAGTNDRLAGCGIICDEKGPAHGAVFTASHMLSGRRFLAESTSDDVVVFANALRSGRQRITLWGEPVATGSMAAELAAKGMDVREAPLPGSGHATALDVAAICGMQTLSKAPLVAPTLRVRDTDRMNRAAWACAAGIVAAAILGIGLLRIDTERRLARVEAQRADLSGRVRQAMDVRSQMENAADIAQMLRDREADASRTNATIAQIARALPRSSALTALTVSGDSVTIEGEAPHSADVYNALRQLPILNGIRLAAPLRQERSASDSIVERFSFSSVVRAPKPNVLAVK